MCLGVCGANSHHREPFILLTVMEMALVKGNRLEWGSGDYFGPGKHFSYSCIAMAKTLLLGFRKLRNKFKLDCRRISGSWIKVHSSLSCENSSHLLKEIISVTSGRRNIQLPVVAYQSPCQHLGSLSCYPKVLVIYFKGHVSIPSYLRFPTLCLWLPLLLFSLCSFYSLSPDILPLKHDPNQS